MKPILQNFYSSFISFITFSFLMICSLVLFAQAPRDVPHPSDNEPLSFDNTATIITFLVLPLLFVAFYFWLRWRKKKKVNGE